MVRHAHHRGGGEQADVRGRVSFLPLEGGGLMVRHAHHRGGGEDATVARITPGQPGQHPERRPELVEGYVLIPSSRGAAY